MKSAVPSRSDAVINGTGHEDPGVPTPSDTLDTVPLTEESYTFAADVMSQAETDPQTAPESLDDILVYNPIAIALYYGRRPLQIIFRLIEVIWIFLGYGSSLLWDRQFNLQTKNEAKRAVQFREVLTQLGPAYIKIGQALSTRPDLVPPSYIDEMVKLQDQLPAFSNEIALQFIQDELGAAPDQIYADLSPKPVAAASLGQVYKGRLHTGETVAVKVQRPGLAQNITRDLYILRNLARWLGRFPQVRSDLVSIMDEFGTRIFEEMDYSHEGQNAERFAELYGHLPNIIVPRIYETYTARRVLTMEWIEGTKLTEPEKLESQGLSATEIIEIGVQCSLRQLLEHGFFHADPHPGNLLVTAEGNLAYLDFGMMSEVKPHQRYGLIEAIVHMVNRDFEGLAADYIKLEFLTPDTDLSPIIPALAEVFNNALGASVAELNLKSMTDEFSALMYEYPFRVPAYYALIIRSLVTLDGIAISVDPDFKVLSKAYPYVSKRLLTDPSPELRQSLQELLFKEGQFRWNRLENLLRNASNSEDYDLGRLLNQTIEFLFSERGDDIRNRLADELAKELDKFGYSLLVRMRTTVEAQLGFSKTSPSPAAPSDSKATVTATPQSSSWEHLITILGILRQTKGFDIQTLATVLPQLLTKPATHHMGRRVMNGLVQRGMARLIREFLMSRPTPDAQKGLLSAAQGTS